MITYPLALPSVGFASIALVARDVVGMAESPFTLTQQLQRHQGQAWELDISLPPMRRADAEEWIVFLLALNGMYGTFLARDGISGAPRGSWAGTPVLDGAVNALASELPLTGFDVGATVKKGDYLQLGSGATSRLHKVLADATADGSGEATLDIWPSVRAAMSSGDAVIANNSLGLFRLALNERRWDIGTAQIYGLQFTAIEAL